MACEKWRNAWKDPEFAIALQSGTVWNAYPFLSRPYQVAVQILECLAESLEPLSYAEIEAKVGIDKTTVSQCLNCLQHAGYPIELKRTAKINIGRPSRAIELGDTKKFSTPPDASWLHMLAKN